MRQHYVIDSAATLLGVALLIVTGVHLTGKASMTFADELAFGAALLFLGSIAASHWAVSRSRDRFEDIAGSVFAVALLLLFVSVVSFWF